MANVLTYRQILDTLQDIARRHYQINTFFVGENHDLNAEDLIYPVLHVRPTAARFPQTAGEYKTVEMKLEVRVLDKQLQNGIDEPDVTNDTFQICQDVINEINQHPYYTRSNTTILGDIDLSTLNEYNDDFVCGWSFDLNLQMINTNSFCGLPMEDITGYSANGPVNSGYTIQYNYLQCNDRLSACTYLDSFIDYKIATNTGSTANYYTTGATLLGSTAYFSRNDMASAYTLDLSSLVVTNYLPLSGGTVTGPTLFSNNLSATTYYSGSTNLYDIIQNSITGVTSGLTGSVNINGLNTYTGGSIASQTINISGLTINNINVSGSSVFNTLTATSVSATTFYSGSTDLSTVINSAITGITSGLVNTHVQNGLNTYTGGTAELPTVNISAATLAYLSATTISGGTLYSGNTDVSLLFATPQNISLINNQLNTKANLSGATFTGGIYAPAISGGTIYSAGTDLYNIFLTQNDGNDITRVQPGLNTYTGGTPNEPTVNISAATLSTLNVSGATSLGIVSATTMYSGSTDVSLLFATPENISLINSQLLTKANLSGATFTGNISAPSISAITTLYSGSTDVSLLFATPENVSLINSQLATKANLSGATFTGAIIAPSAYITSLSGGTLFSGNTDVSLLFATPENIALITNQLATKANLSGATFTGNIYAPQISGGTLYSGSTDVSTLFATPQNISLINSQLNTKANLSGATFTGNIFAPSISATTFYSGSTELSTLIPNPTFVQNGLNTYTGGTSSNPSVNVSGLTINNINVSGSATFNTLSATTVSAQTYYLSGQSIYDMFAKTGTTGMYIEVYTASTTWSVPDDVRQVTVELWGGGGGGGCGSKLVGGGYTLGGGGGASGAYVIGTVAVSPGSAMTITVGSGGTPGYGVGISSASGTGATNGGNTIFGSLIATGGTKGTNATYNSSNGTGGIATSLYPNQDTVFTPSYIFTRGFDGQNGVGVPATSDSAGGVGADVPVFGRAIFNALSGGTGGATPVSSTPQVGGSATYFAGGGAGGTGELASDPNYGGYTGGSGSSGLIILRYVKGTGSNYIFTNTFSGGTINGATNFTSTISSGGTDLSLLFATPANITDLSNRLATKANLSGATFTGAVVAPSISATTISGGTLYSGSTELGSLFATPANITSINSQLSTKIDKSGDTWTNTLRGTALSATTLSGGTIYSGNTDVSTLFATPANITDLSDRLATKANLSGATFTGNVVLVNASATTFSATTLSATTLYSGSTELGSLFATPANITLINSQLATKLNASGDVWTNTLRGSALSATTLSGGTIYSGSSELGTLFRSTGSTLPFEIGIAMSDETTVLASASTATVTLQIPFSGTLTSVYFSVGTSGSTISTYNVKKSSTPGVGGTTIFSTRPTIDANEFSTATAAAAQVITASTFSQYDTFTFFIDQAATGSKSLKAWLIGTKIN